MQKKKIILAFKDLGYPLTKNVFQVYKDNKDYFNICTINIYYGTHFSHTVNKFKHRQIRINHFHNQKQDSRTKQVAFIY